MSDLKAVIASHPFFHDMKPRQLSAVARGATEQEFGAGDYLFRVKEPADHLYLIESGSVMVEAHETAGPTVPVEELRGGDVLGWSWLFPPYVWHFQARALEPTRVIALNGAHLLTTSQRDHTFGCELMKRVTQMLIHRLMAIQKRLLADHVEPAKA